MDPHSSVGRCVCQVGGWEQVHFLGFLFPEPCLVSEVPQVIRVLLLQVCAGA